MLRRLRAGLLLAAMLVASVAPSLAVCAGDESQDAMSCCKRDDHCQREALSRACCPCAPQTPAQGPASGAVLQPPVLSLAASAWLLADLTPPTPPPALHDAAGLAVRHRASHDPPWLLHGALLI
jgi:hypothetical protein